MALTERLADMAVFAQVVNSQGFSAAARELDISVAAVSKAVMRLEAHLALRLLNRSTRKLTLTEAGSTFYDHCQHIVAAAGEAELHLGQLQSEPRGVLKLAVPTTFGLMQVVPLMPRLLQRYPELQVELDLFHASPDIIGSGIDLMLEFGEPRESALVARKLATTRTLIVASPDYLQAHGAPRVPQDLLHHACLVSQCGTAHWDFASAGETISVLVRGPLRATNMLALHKAALADLGIVRLPSFCVGDDLQAGRLKCLLNDWTPPPNTLYALYPNRRHMPAKVKAVLDFFIEYFGEQAQWNIALKDARCFANCDA